MLLCHSRNDNQRDDLELGSPDDFSGTTTCIEVLAASTKAWPLLSLSFPSSICFWFRASGAFRASASFFFFVASAMGSSSVLAVGPRCRRSSTPRPSAPERDPFVFLTNLLQLRLIGKRD